MWVEGGLYKQVFRNGEGAVVEREGEEEWEGKGGGCGHVVAVSILYLCLAS